MGMTNFVLHLGETAGDLMRVPLSSLRGRVDFLVAGPPCPPWSAQGRRGGQGDRRSNVFVRVLQWIIYFAKGCGLLGFALENVMGIMHNQNGRVNYMSRVLDALRTTLPEFDFPT
eukprot:949877-Pyramimonas_sp.AAC.1